jgi:hypothetical protein
MELLDHFRKSAGAGWVCKRAVRLRLDNGRQVRLRPGQEVYTGDFRFRGMDLAVSLDLQLGPLGEWANERPQSISAALAL